MLITLAITCPTSLYMVIDFPSIPSPVATAPMALIVLPCIILRCARQACPLELLALLINNPLCPTQPLAQLANHHRRLQGLAGRLVHQASPMTARALHTVEDALDDALAQADLAAAERDSGVQNSSTSQPALRLPRRIPRKRNGYMDAATFVFTRASSVHTPLTSCTSSWPSAAITKKSAV